MEAILSIESALDHWSSMYVQLSNSIQSYISACKTLGAVCARDHQTRARDVAENAFVLLDSKLGSLAAEENALRTSRCSLSALRNKSKTLAPINMLPPEILTRIFLLSLSTNCGHEDPIAFSHNFVGTCAHWRQLALGTSYFWTHIDVGPNISEKLNKLMLERAKTHPLHLHIFNYKLSETNYDPNSLLEDLQPLMRRLHSLELFNFEGTFVGSMVKLWLEHGDEHLVKLLSIFQHTPRVSFNDRREAEPLMNTSEHGEQILLSLQELHLYDVRFNWDSNAYRGLVDLRLKFVNASAFGTISSSELAHILRASPMLAILKLGNLRVTGQVGPLQAIPVPLNHLKVLNLTEMRLDCLRWLLPLIALPRSSSELSVGLAFHKGLEDELKNFLDRSPITSLYCFCMSYNFGAWSSILAPLGALRTLILDMRAFEELIDDVAPSQDDVAANSHYLRLTLKGCYSLFENINSLVSNLGVNELHIEAPVDAPVRYGIDQTAEEYWADIRTDLIRAHPNLRYTIDEEFATDTEHHDISPYCWP
ncbi:hypothetical protein FRC12_019724 [Ceratobasidium sp. 428]|nr:hypothetical protein FRC12_019724 [Ceratobasidium sp. 428]